MVQLTEEDMREGLRLERELAAARDLQSVAHNRLNRFVGHLAALYDVPEGWRLVDWLRGFEPAGEPTGEPAGGGNHQNG